MRLRFEWDVDPEVDSSDHRDDKPAYPLYVCSMYDLDGPEDGEGLPILASVGACDFGPDHHPGDAFSGEYRREIESQLAAEVAAR
jgi:hypothetical protein